MISNVCTFPSFPKIFESLFAICSWYSLHLTENLNPTFVHDNDNLDSLNATELEKVLKDKFKAKTHFQFPIEMI